MLRIIIILLLLMTNISYAGSFVDNNDGTVTDLDTNLIWEQHLVDKTFYYDWQGALDYCNNLNLAGHVDWRLPNRKELESLLDYNRSGPAIDEVFTFTSASPVYWSSTTNGNVPSEAWAESFDAGNSSSVLKTYYEQVRCVR